MNNVSFTWQEITDACGGSWLLTGRGDGICGVLDDSRVITPGSLFAAIVGERSDGHAYITAAAKAGAAAVIVQRAPAAEQLAELAAASCACLLVDDSLVAFQALANAHRRRFPALPLVGITGSCGKTSTKEMTAAVLQRAFGPDVLKTIGNTNNFFGAPRNLLRLTADTPAAVIEMGSNHPGEIHRLATMVQPRTGIVCNIGAAHLEFFHDLLGVAEEKGDLLEALPPDGTAIVPGEAVGLDILRRHAGSRRLITFGSGPDNDVRGEYLGVTAEGYGLRLSSRLNGQSVTFTWPVGGAHQAVNAAAAAAAGLVYGLSLADIAEGLKACQLPGARMNVQDIGGVKWVNDAYNANPNSMRAALDWFAEITANAPRKTLVLGDMKELGDAAPQAHADLLAIVAQRFPQARVFTVGALFAPYAATYGFTNFPTAADAAETLRLAPPAPGEWLLLKGSNSIGLSALMPTDK